MSTAGPPLTALGLFTITHCDIDMALYYGGGVMPKLIRSRLTNSIPSGSYAGGTHGITCNVWSMEDNRSKGIANIC